MYYPDLSPYSYYLDFSILEVSNVGWLGVDFPFKKGNVPPSTLHKMEEILIGSKFVDAHVNVIRGMHPCNICGKDCSNVSDGCIAILGRSELWLPTEKNGYYFAAPTMIFHYIKEHSYSPPFEFMQAVENLSLRLPFNAQERYLSLVERYR